MSRVIVYFTHPGQRHSRANSVMAKAAKTIEGITFVDLYAEYPRHDIDVEQEQRRLLDHDVIVFQFPLYWYSTPSLLKEWQDLVLQHGFAYGHGGDKLTGKSMVLAITTGGSDEAYTATGYQNFPLRSFLYPLEQTARLCGMTFAPPYVLYSALQADEEGAIANHTNGYKKLLNALQDETFDFAKAEQQATMTFSDLPIREKA